MFRFIAYLEPTPKLKTQLIKFSILSAGLFCGYVKGFLVNERYENINAAKLTTYQTEDQINMLIEKQQKPAVIYYALPINRQHALFRQLMFKYSNLYPQNAIWTMVNLNKKLQQAKPALDYKFKTRVMLEIRFPKSQVAIKIGEEGNLVKINQKMHRREGFCYNYNDEGFKKFLQENRVISGTDPIHKTLSITKNALFNSIAQNKTSQSNKI